MSDAFRRHRVLFNDAPYLWFEAHVQHTICLIQDQVAEVKTGKESSFELKTKKIKHNTDIYPSLSPSAHVLLAVVQPDLASLHHVHQSSWSGHQQVTAPLQVSDLLPDVCSSIHNTGTHSGAVGKLTRKEEALTNTQLEEEKKTLLHADV